MAIVTVVSILASSSVVEKLANRNFIFIILMKELTFVSLLTHVLQPMSTHSLVLFTLITLRVINRDNILGSHHHILIHLKINYNLLIWVVFKIGRYPKGTL
jgi:hypothetical protein